MASTYSNLKIQLMATGENSGTWGNVTNTNLGTALEQAITGSADVAVNADTSITLTDTNGAQNARALRLNLSGAGGFNLTVPNIQKLYLVNNGSLGTVTVKNSTGATIAVPTSKTMWVFSTGTGVVDAVTHLTSLTLGSALPIASGGTGSTSTTYANLQSNVTGTLPVGNGGTGQTTYTDGQLLIGNTTGNTLTKATLTGTANQITVTNGGGSITLSTPQSTGTSSNVQFGSFGVGTAASGTTGEIRATNNVTAYYSSDERLKDNVQTIENALNKISQIRGVEFDWNNLQEPEDGYFVRKHDIGVIAQEVEKVLPEVVGTRKDGIKAVKYDRLVPLLIEAIKELKAEIDNLKGK